MKIKYNINIRQKMKMAKLRATGEPRPNVASGHTLPPWLQGVRGAVTRSGNLANVILK